MILDVVEPLHVRVARALGWTNLRPGRGYTPMERGTTWIGKAPDGFLNEDGVPDYANDWEETGPLIEKYRIAVGPEGSGWSAMVDGAPGWNTDDGWPSAFGGTPLEAVCRILLRMLAPGLDKYATIAHNLPDGR